MNKKYRGKYLRKKRLRRGGGLALGMLMVFFAGVAAFGGWKFYTQQQEYQTGTDSYAALASAAVNQQAPDFSGMDVLYYETTLSDGKQTHVNAETAVEGAAAITEPAALQVDFEVLRSVNEQAVAWITGCGGAIHYPVVQSGDNEFYLTHLFDGTANKNGAIFVDCRNNSDFSDRNTFIYGHNMRNGAMFAALANYSSQAYYDAHPALTLVTPDGTYSLQVFSGYVTPGISDSYQMDYADDAAFQAYLDQIQSQSDFVPLIRVTAADRIVTLSTCTYDYEDARYVLHCKLMPMQ